MARPTLLTEELKKEFLGVLRAGNFIRTACEYVGISEQTYFNWRNRAVEEMERVESGLPPDDTEQKYVEFFKAVKKSRKASEIEAVGQIRIAAKLDWRAAAWFLERSHRENWGKKTVNYNYSVESDSKGGLLSEVEERLKRLENKENDTLYLEAEVIRDEED